MPLAILGATTVTPAQRPCESANSLETTATRCIPGVWGVLASNCCGLITRTRCSLAASCLSLLTCCLLLFLLSQRNWVAASKKLALPCSPVDSPVAALCGGLDVLIHAKEIGGIVLALDGRQALVVVPIARFDALLSLLFHHEIHVGAARRVGMHIVPVLPGPVDDEVLVRRVRIDSPDHLGPGGLPVTPRRVVFAHPVRRSIHWIQVHG